jgi:hypothetical protein
MSGNEDKQGEPPDRALFIDGSENAARAIAAATAQIDLALRESHGPVEALGNTLERMSEHLLELRKRLRSHSQHCEDAQGMLEMDLVVEALSGQMVTAIQSMQFYDRLFQHLSHVHDYLSGGADALANSALSPFERGKRAEDEAKRWEVLRERLFSRLLSDAQRQVLDIVLPPKFWDKSRNGSLRAAAHAGPGEIELF